MDPSIVKLLEEDEDESMHSGADVDAFQAALNRDIEGAVSTSQPSDPNMGSNHTFGQSFAEWQKAREDDSTNLRNLRSAGSSQQQHLPDIERLQNRSVSESNKEQNGLPEANQTSLLQHQSQSSRQLGQAVQHAPQIPQTSEMQMGEKNALPSEPQRLHNQDSESQYAKLQKMSSQQASSTEQPNNPNRGVKQVPFAVLLPSLLPQLDKDRAMQLHTLYTKLKKNEISKDGFVRHMREIVGDQVLRLAINKLQSQMSSTQGQMVPRALGRQNHPTQIKPKMESFYPSSESGIQKSREVERQLDYHATIVGQMSATSSGTMSTSTSVQGLNKHPQQHLHLPPDSFSMYGSTGSSFHPHPGSSLNTSVSSLKPQPHDSHMRQVTHSQTLGSNQFRGSSHPMSAASVPQFERPNSMNDPCRMQGGSLSHFSAHSQQSPVQGTAGKEQTPAPLSSVTHVKQESLDQCAEQHPRSYLTAQQGFSAAQVAHGLAAPGIVKDELLDKLPSRASLLTSSSTMPTSSVSPSMTSQLDSSASLNQSSSPIPSLNSQAGLNARTPPKKPSTGQKKPLETLGSSPPPSSKKQKVSAASLDQSIEQLNDVTAVSGVNLREEEEQLFSGPKEDSRVSEASRRVVQEEEERLILQKIPLQKKLAEIMVKNGLKNVNHDVERCLSLCVEERMRGLISNIIRLSKQRVDAEKPRHRTVVTSDIRQQIIAMNQKVREEWEKKQAEAEKLRKLYEPEGDDGAEGDKEKDEGRSKSMKVQVNREEDDKMRTTAANVAARAAVGGDDMLSKWQLMAEQARQKREGGSDAASGSQGGKDTSRKSVSGTGRNSKDAQEGGKRSGNGGSRKSGRNQAGSLQTGVPCTISIKDVIAVLEREPQMSRSTLIYRLYEKVCSEAAAE